MASTLRKSSSIRATPRVGHLNKSNVILDEMKAVCHASILLSIELT
jgi:hypothetical protein